MSTLPSASKIVSTTFNKDLINIYSVSEVYSATVSFTGGTGGTYTGTVPLSPGYNTTTYKVVPSIVCTLQNATSGQYLYDVIITSRTETTFTYSIYVAAGFSSINQTITLDFLVSYYVYNPLTGVSASYTGTGDYTDYSVNLTWDFVSGANSYNVKLTKNNDAGTITSVSSIVNLYTFHGLSLFDNLGNNNKYAFSVQAVNSQGGSDYIQAIIDVPTVGTATAVSGIDSGTFINYADITLTGSNSGPFYKITTTPNTGATSTLSDSWTTSTLSTNITCTRNNLITNFNYGFIITAYNIAGTSSSTKTINNFKPVNNFMFSYTTTELPPPGTSGGDATQQQREGIFNYLPFYYGNPTKLNETGQLTLSPLLYTTDIYITWTPTSPYTVTISFPQYHTDSTPLWVYTHPPVASATPYRAGIAISWNIYGNENPVYRQIADYYAAATITNPQGGKVSSLTYNNFGSIPISGGASLWYSDNFYTNIFNITNNSIPIFPQNTKTGMDTIGLFVRLRPSQGSIINLSNWDVSNVTQLRYLFNNCEFNYGTGVAIDISKWNVSNITVMNNAIWNIRLGPMEDLNWNLQSIQSMVSMFGGGSNFNSNLNFIFPTSTPVNLSSMFESAGSFNKNISTRTVNNITYWNVSNVTNISNMFKNATSFNNGGAANDTTHPLNWAFTSTPTSTDWHLNSPLTSANGVTTPPLY